MIVVILILIYLCLRLAPPIHRFCQAVFPTNIVLRYFRQRDRLRWGVPVGLAGAAFYYGLYLVLLDGRELEMDFRGILTLLGGFFIVVSFGKFAFFVPYSVIALVSHLIREAVLLWRVRGELRREAKADGAPAPEFTAEQRRQLRVWAREILATR